MLLFFSHLTLTICLSVFYFSVWCHRLTFTFVCLFFLFGDLCFILLLNHFVSFKFIIIIIIDIIDWPVPHNMKRILEKISSITSVHLHPDKNLNMNVPLTWICGQTLSSSLSLHPSRTNIPPSSPFLAAAGQPWWPCIILSFQGKFNREGGNVDRMWTLLTWLLLSTAASFWFTGQSRFPEREESLPTSTCWPRSQHKVRCSLSLTVNVNSPIFIFSALLNSLIIKTCLISSF